MTTRVLIVKLAALGDAVMASALVPAIRVRWPDAHIGWAAGHGIAPFVRLIEGVDDVIEVSDRDLLRGTRRAQLRAVLSAWRRIGRGWDVAIVAHTDKRYGILTRFSGAGETVRFAGALGPRRGEFYGTQYARLVTGDNGETHAVTPTPGIRTATLPPAPVRVSERPLVVVAPGGARNLLRDDVLRRWPVEEWAATTKQLVAAGFDVVAIGGDADAAECEQCAMQGAVNYCGRTSVPELMSLLKHADVLITHDSGPMHLAIALNRPVVALFGPTSPSDFVPSGANVIVLSAARGLACAPCYDGNGFAPCANNLCVRRVTVHEVLAAAKHQLIYERATTALPMR